jgi:hypothetical protein
MACSFWAKFYYYLPNSHYYVLLKSKDYSSLDENLPHRIPPISRMLYSFHLNFDPNLMKASMRNPMLEAIVYRMSSSITKEYAPLLSFMSL